MRTRIVTQSRAPAASRVGVAWVTSPHLLVAQAVASALQQQHEEAFAVAWRDVRRNAPHIGPRDVVVVIDDLDSSRAIHDIGRLVNEIPAPVVVLTAHPATHVWGGLFDAGVSEVIASTSSVRALSEAVTKVSAGVRLMDAADRAALLEGWAQAQADEEELIKRLGLLSPRERRVLELLASGQRVASIEAELGVSQSTVRSQVKSLRRKLGVDSQLGAVAVLQRMRGSSELQHHMPSPRGPVD